MTISEVSKACSEQIKYSCNDDYTNCRCEQGCRKVFKTGQPMFNPEHCVIKCVGDQLISNVHMACLSLTVCCSKSIKPTNHFSTVFIT